MDIFHYIMLYCIVGFFVLMTGSLTNKMGNEGVNRWDFWGTVLFVIVFWPVFFLDLIFNILE